MNLLLDTHTFLWFIGGDSRLPENARTLIEDIRHQRFLSIASLWEISIKLSIGKLDIDMELEELLSDHIESNAIHILQIRFADMLEVSRMPFHHRDPFDRLIIAQAIVDGMPILSIDDVFDSYGVQRQWA
jgi:PIN domain nuclease of toxin-antitoxin system